MYVHRRVRRPKCFENDIYFHLNASNGIGVCIVACPSCVHIIMIVLQKDELLFRNILSATPPPLSLSCLCSSRVREEEVIED